MTYYISTEEALIVHFRIIKSFGGTHGVRDLSLLESALARPQAGFGEHEAYPDIFTKAAVLLHSLAKNHPFIDGNKRTSLAVTKIFLKRNEYDLFSRHQKTVEFMVHVAEGKLDEEAIATWLKKNSTNT
jgi:death-on-curing protein